MCFNRECSVVSFFSLQGKSEVKLQDMNKSANCS